MIIESTRIDAQTTGLRRSHSQRSDDPEFFEYALGQGGDSVVGQVPVSVENTEQRYDVLASDNSNLRYLGI